MRSINEKFSDLGNPRRIWAVAAVNGDIGRLMALHDHLAARFSVQDRLVYLGNYVGHNSKNNEMVFQELLAFRSALLAKTGVKSGDVVHLRGPTEEAWQRLLRLQFAPVPTQTLEKLYVCGVDAYLRLYGASMNDTRATARAGSVAITRLTNQLRVAQRAVDGHEQIVSSMRRAAITRPEENGGGRLLFVPAGFDCSRSLDDQGDNIWFENAPFRNSVESSGQYARIVRGFDVSQSGIDTNGFAVTLDGGCGRGGPLMCGCFHSSGRFAEIIAIGGKGAVESTKYEQKQNRAVGAERRSSLRIATDRIPASV